MSVHNAPIQSLHNSKSNRSLYTENSQQSDINVTKIQQANYKQSPRREEPISQKIQRLPKIIPQNTQRQPYLIKQKPKQLYDNMPTLPIKNISNRYKDQDEFKPKGVQLGNIGGPQFNTIAVTSLERNQFRNAYGQPINPMRMTGLSGIYPQSNQNQRTRMLRSSQGGRWFRSQSLMQDKGKETKGANNIDLMIRNYHKHQSKNYEKLQSYIKFYSLVEKHLHEKGDIFYKYKISLTDSLEQIKNKMETFLQTKIDLSNLPIDRPDSGWGQQELMKFYTSYNQILQQKISLNQTNDDKQKLTTVLKKYKNCTYYGPVKDGKKHGFGYLHYFSGRFYEGFFQNDQKIKGFQMDDSQLYIGQYEKNQRHGQGILKTNQYLISGVFANGQFKLDSSENQTSSAGFSKSKQLGVTRKGFKIQFSLVTFYTGGSTLIEKNNSNDIFIGQVNQQSQKQGQGLQIFSNGDLYIGTYQQDAPEGYGEYYWDSGAFYRGDFLSGMRHGKGLWMMVHGDKYAGDYLNDKKNGKGIYTWKSGDRYQGQFQNDYRHGYGQMYWRDGTSYKGQWLNGIQVNKTFKIGNEQKDSHSNSKVTQPSATKNSFKSVKTKTRVLKLETNNKSIERKSRNSQTIQQTSSVPERNPYLLNNKKIPLQKLKSMLNPSNSIN